MRVPDEVKQLGLSEAYVETYKTARREAPKRGPMEIYLGTDGGDVPRIHLFASDDFLNGEALAASYMADTTAAGRKYLLLTVVTSKKKAIR